MNANEQQLLQALSISANNDSVDLEDCKLSFRHKLNDYIQKHYMQLTLETLSR